MLTDRTLTQNLELERKEDSTYRYDMTSDVCLRRSLSISNLQFFFSQKPKEFLKEGGNVLKV